MIQFPLCDWEGAYLHTWGSKELVYEYKPTENPGCRGSVIHPDTEETSLMYKL